MDLALRDVVEADLPILFEHQADPVACQIAAYRPRDLEGFMVHWLKVMADSTVMKRTIIFNGDVAGSIVSFERSGERQVGYWIGRKHWGKGIASRALAEFVPMEQTRPLHAHVAIKNRASIRVLEKCGFQVSHYDRPPADGQNEEVDEIVMVLAARSGGIGSSNA